VIALSLLLALQSIAAPVQHTGAWSDPIQTDPTYGALNTGPYTMRVQPHGQPWTMYSVDNVHRFESGMAWSAWFAPLDGYSPTMYRTNVHNYRKAWYVTRAYAERGPACYCWHNVQHTMWHLVGLSYQYDSELLDEANEWYAATGLFSDWRQAYVVTDVERERMEFVTGVVVELTPGLPDDPYPPVSTVPEPATLYLMLAGLAVLLVIGLLPTRAQREYWWRNRARRRAAARLRAAIQSEIDTHHNRRTWE